MRNWSALASCLIIYLNISHKNILEKMFRPMMDKSILGLVKNLEDLIS